MNLLELLYHMKRSRMSGRYNLIDMSTSELGYVQFFRGEVSFCILGQLTAVSALSKAYILDKNDNLKLTASSKENNSMVNITLDFGHLLARIFENFLNYKKLKKNFNLKIKNELKADKSFYYIKEIVDENSKAQSR